MKVCGKTCRGWQPLGKAKGKCRGLIRARLSKDKSKKKTPPI